MTQTVILSPDIYATMHSAYALHNEAIAPSSILTRKFDSARLPEIAEQLTFTGKSPAPK